MAIVIFEGSLSSKRFDDHGNCFFTLEIKDSYYIPHIHSIERAKSHTPRTNEFCIVNSRPLSCINNIDIITYAPIGAQIEIKACELFDMAGKPVNKYSVLDINSYPANFWED